MNAVAENEWAQRVLGSARIEGGQLTLPDDQLAELGRQIHDSPDPAVAATAMVALATRLKDIPGARPVANQVVALAAIALGDEPLNRALNIALYGG